MAMDFPSPSQRAAGGDLALQISPLGIIELSDEEFEVHGPRLTRYSNAAAFYLGHHWAYKKQAGEPMLSFNYARALSDFLTNFGFTKDVTFKCPWEFQHIVPALLDRIWNTDNNKAELQWNMGNLGSIFGDVFVKVTYMNAYVDDSGQPHPGRVMIMPLNPANCFPRWHPHEPGRMEEFKLKYKFWSTAPDGTRLVNTYVEVITVTEIKEYLNDQLVNERPNPMGEIPIVHIKNRIAAGSPWGLPDIQPDFVTLNREYNEKATDISDIINYHVAPITVITGGKPANLVRGPNKIWGVEDDAAKVYNLEGGWQGLAPAMEYLELIKTAMCEMMGVPVTALGQEQAISNTSGVALAIQYMPTMQVFDQKKVTYTVGYKEISRLALKTLLYAEPDQIYYNPNTDGIMQEGQPPFIDPDDNDVYKIDIEWRPPLPVDVIIKLQEIEQKIMLGLESKKGALRELGEEFPDEKLKELFDEQIDEIKQDSAKMILKAQAQAITMALTGIVPEDAEPVDNEPPKPNADGSTPPAAPTPPAQQQQNLPNLPNLAPDVASIIGESGKNMFADIVRDAYGSKQSPRRNIDGNDNDTRNN